MTVMTARYAGTCAATGRRFKPGARIDYDRSTKTSKLVDDTGDDTGDSTYMASRTRSSGYVSSVFRTSEGEYYRNKAGRCEDAPCCGCCTI